MGVKGDKECGGPLRHCGWEEVLTVREDGREVSWYDLSLER